MPTTDVAYISGKTLAWARNRAGLTTEELAREFGKGLSEAQLIAWETEDAFPTIPQAERIAEKLRVPFGILFMPDPPSTPMPLPDLRTIVGGPAIRPSLEFLEVVNDCLLRQHWYAEYQQEERAAPMQFVGRFTLNSPVSDVATDIARTLNLTDERRNVAVTWQGFLSMLIAQAELNGVLVMRSSVVRHASRRHLSEKEFRGFAISDPLAPLVFINTADALCAQIFTLAHELAHIWIGQTGISNPDPKLRRQELPNEVERFCNAVAGEFLVPAANVEKLWITSQDSAANIQRIAAFHRVSRTVVAIRSRELGKIEYVEAAAFIDAEVERFKTQKAMAAEREGGPTFWVSFGPRNSQRFTAAVIDALQVGRVLHRDAAALLGVKLKTVHNYQERLGAG